jgi:hypothetical protein
MSDIDPGKEWQRLTELYARKYDSELLRLFEERNDLTPIAQEALRAEMQSRRLSFPVSMTEGERNDSRSGSKFQRPTVGEYLSWSEEEPDSDEGEGREPYFVTKVLLREFSSREEAMTAKHLLGEAGIQSWVEAANNSSLDMRAPRVLVAADQLEEANHLLPDILPGELVAEMGQEVEDFVLPCCPGCGAENPLLQSFEEKDHANHWYCESCGRKWEEKLAEEI